MNPSPPSKPPEKTFATAVNPEYYHEAVKRGAKPLLNPATSLDSNMASPDLNHVKARRGFLDLSAELRNEIYELALIEPDHGVIILPTKYWNDDDTITPCKHFRLSLQVHLLKPEPNILLACQQIRKEALAIYYGGNAFQCTSRAGFVT